MRVLIVAAILAVASSAPSGELVVPAAIPAAVPTVSNGDLQAAAIDTKVLIEDQAQLLADQARLLNDQAREQTEQIIEERQAKALVAENIAKEQAEETLWSVEDKKWQAVDAVKTAEAQIDGAVASNADALAKSVVGFAPGGAIAVAPAGTIPVAAAAPVGIAPVAPVISPYASVIAPLPFGVPGFITPGFKTIIAEPVNKLELKEPGLKTAIPDNNIQAAPEKSTEATPEKQPETRVLKATENKPELPQLPLIAPWPAAPLTSPLLAAPIAYFNPGLKTYSIQPSILPTLVNL